MGTQPNLPYLNRCIGLALSVVRRNPACPSCRAAVSHLNRARRLALDGYVALASVWMWRASEELRKAGI